MKASRLLQRVRSQSGLSIRELGAAAGVAASSVHRIEHEEMGPTVEMLERLFEAAGMQLVLEARPDYILSVFGLARAFRDEISRGETAQLVRMSAELSHRFSISDHAQRRRMVTAAPDSTGDDRWDRFLEALVEWLCVEHKEDIPEWALTRNDMSEGWWVTKMKTLRAWEYAGSPISFKRRGVFIHRDSLINV